MPDDLREQHGDLLAGLVDRRSDEVRGALAGELDDPFAQVRLDSGDAVRGEVFVEIDLFGRHRLRLDDELRPLRPADRGDHAARLLGIDRAIDLRAYRLGFLGKAGDERGDVIDRVFLTRGEVGAQSGPIDLPHAVGAPQAERRQRAVERDPQLVRVERAVELAAEFGLGGGHESTRYRIQMSIVATTSVASVAGTPYRRYCANVIGWPRASLMLATTTFADAPMTVALPPRFAPSARAQMSGSRSTDCPSCWMSGTIVTV